MLIFSVMVAEQYSKTWINQEESLFLDPGFYKIQLIGAKGGGRTPELRGQPAKLRAVMKIESRSYVHVVAGAYPAYGDVGEGGKVDNVNNSGGGYSAIFVNSILYAMVGGGGGSAYNGGDLKGLPAGGEGYVYDQPNHFINKTGTPDFHQGGYVQGSCSSDVSLVCSGGGGGYFGGAAGTASNVQGQGGSSYANPKLSDVEIADGNTESLSEFNLDMTQLNGIVKIESTHVCGDGCAECNDINYPNRCTKCRPERHLYKRTNDTWVCIVSCDDTEDGSFEHSDGHCELCTATMGGCLKCRDADTCTECHYKFILNSTTHKCDYNTSYPTPLPFPTLQPYPTITQIPATESLSLAPTKSMEINGLKLGLKGNKNNGERLQWWIIAVAVGCVALIAIIVAIILYKKRNKEDSVEMVNENAVDVNSKNTTTVTYENSLYTDSMNAEEDPFKRDFDEDQDESGIFQEELPPLVDADVEIDA